MCIDYFTYLMVSVLTCVNSLFCRVLKCWQLCLLDFQRANEELKLGDYNINILIFSFLYQGYVASYYGAEFHKYSAFRVHIEEDVRTNLAFPQGVLSLTPSSLRGTLRRGLSVFTFK